MAGITTQDVQQAAQELARMRGSLARWLRYRALGDRVLAGTAPVRKPLAYAQRVITTGRDASAEQDLATKLATLLAELMPGQALPNPDLTANPNGAVQLAQLALSGPSQVAQPTATGSITSAAAHPWLWPVLIVGGLLLAVITAVKTAADVVEDQEHTACIESGACTDYGFWLKAGAITAIAWVAWREMGLREALTKKGKDVKGR